MNKAQHELCTKNMDAIDDGTAELRTRLFAMLDTDRSQLTPEEQAEFDETVQRNKEALNKLETLIKETLSAVKGSKGGVR